MNGSSIVENLQVVLQIAVLALLVEALVTTLKPIWDPEKRDIDFFITLGVGQVLAVGTNYLAGLDLFAALGVPLLKLPVVGVILTGVLISRGGNFVHDLFKMIQALKLRILTPESPPNPIR